MLEIKTPQTFLEFIRNERKDNGNLSTRGVAKCCGVDHTALIRGGDFKSQKLAEKLGRYGFKGGDLASDGWSPKATYLTIQYYAFESRTPKDLAKQLAETFGEIGIMTTLAELGKSPNPSLAIEGVNPEVQCARDISEIENLLSSQPRMRQILLDQRFNNYLESNNLFAPSSEPILKSTEQIATELGHKVNMSSRVKLGQFTKRSIGHLAQKEERLCNGAMRSINCYPDIPQVRLVVSSFFN